MLFQAEFWTQVPICCWYFKWFNSNLTLLDSKWYQLQTPWNRTLMLFAHHLMTFAQSVNWSFMSLKLRWNKLRNRGLFFPLSTLTYLIFLLKGFTSVQLSHPGEDMPYLFVYHLTISDRVTDICQPEPLTTQPNQNPKDYKIMWNVHCSFYGHNLPFLRLSNNSYHGSWLTQ